MATTGIHATVLTPALGWVRFWNRYRVFGLLSTSLVAVSLLAALHNRGHEVFGVAAVLSCFAFPLAMGARPASWLAWPRSGWILPLVVSLWLWLVPTTAVVAAVRFHVQGLLYHPTAFGFLGWLAERLPICVILVAAEEFFFRGWLQQSICVRTRRPVAWSAALFALAHVATTGLVGFTPLWFVSGCTLGWVTRRAGGSLWPALVLHASGNLALAWTGTLIAMNLPFFAP
jgi:membrane protease YdiL (CAAX protease family)